MIIRFLSIFIVCLSLLSCNSTIDTLIDVNGNVYPITTINGQTWMLENLRVTHTANKQSIKVYYPNNNQENTSEYGLLYDYATACKVCPKGWRLPANEDWDKLFQFPDQNKASLFKDPNYWVNEANTNSSGFSIRPAGYGNNGEFDNFFQTKTILWSYTKDNEHDVWSYILEKDKPLIRKAPQHPTYAFSIRCIKE